MTGWARENIALRLITYGQHVQVDEDLDHIRIAYDLWEM